MIQKKSIWKRSEALAVLGLALVLAACGGSTGGEVTSTLDPSTASLAPPAARTVVGKLDAGTPPPAGGQSLEADPSAMTGGTQVSLDNGTASVPVGPDSTFTMAGIGDGDHTLFLHLGSGGTAEVPFRMLEGRGVNLGTVRVRNGRMEGITGFDGYHFGFVDSDGDGINDLFRDADGDGICDNNALYAGYPYMMERGYADGNGDGVNDRFRDADGDGVNDLDGMPYGHGFGFADEDGDGINDLFADADGDGICDLTGMPYRHPFGYRDGNHDGRNDLFADADGDGINDLTGMPYVGMPGWVDLDGDGANDFFQDADGDGINDITGMPYGHGFGWVDADHDGRNDRFADRDGDARNDGQAGPFALMHYRYGYMAPHADVDGDGIDDVSEMPFGHGFGWVDAEADGRNDAFLDADGDGVNDLTGHQYVSGFGHEAGDGGMHFHEPLDWPMESPHMGGGMM